VIFELVETEFQQVVGCVQCWCVYPQGNSYIRSNGAFWSDIVIMRSDANHVMEGTCAADCCNGSSRAVAWELNYKGGQPKKSGICNDKIKKRYPQGFDSSYTGFISCCN
jgi:hypothetical protein